jgi:Carbohydrate-selective porin, OprB family
VLARGLGIEAEYIVLHQVVDYERADGDLGDTTVPVQTEEWASELFYNLNVGGWLDLRPNVQYVAQPGGVVSTLPVDRPTPAFSNRIASRLLARGSVTAGSSCRECL